MTMSEPAAASASELRDRLDLALASRDRAAAVTTALEAVDTSRITVPELYTAVLVPLLVDTGAAWQAGTTRVWQEHFASAIVRTIVEALYPEVARLAAAAPRRGERVLLANPPQEQHDLGLRMLADRFELAGYDVIYLGTDTPASEIIDAARTVDATLVVLSASTHFNRVQLRSFVAHVREGLPGVRIAVGGPAFALDRDWPASELLDSAALGLPGSDADSPRTAARDGA